MRATMTTPQPSWRGRLERKLLTGTGTHLLLAVGGIIMILPLLWMLSSSIKTLGEVMQLPPTWIPKNPTLQNYPQVFRQFPLWRYLFNSLVVAATVVTSVLVTSSLAGYALVKFRFRGRDLLFIAFMTSLMIPFQVRMLPLYVMIGRTGQMNTFFALVFPWLVDAFGIFLMRQFIKTIPTELIEAARIDGYSEFRIYWNIILPQLKPPLAALGIFTFTNTWEEFLWPLLVSNSDLTRTLPVGLQYFNEQYGANIHLQMAAAVIGIAPLLIVFFMLQKQFIEGITLTGMK